MGQIYEGMFLVDNDVVRAGYAKAKTVVTDVLTKHGATIHTARRWDERRLAYPVSRRQRATYFLSYFELPNEGIEGLRRDLDLSETVLRYLMLAVDAIAEGEAEASAAEDGTDFVVPEPPADDEPDEEPEEEGEDGEKAEGEDGEKAEGAEKAEASEGESKSEDGESTEKTEDAAPATSTEEAAPVAAAETTEGGDDASKES